MHSPKLETGSREHLELHRAQDKGLEICGRSQEETELHYRFTRTCSSSLKMLQGTSLVSSVELVLWAEGKSCRCPHDHGCGCCQGQQ